MDNEGSFRTDNIQLDCRPCPFCGCTDGAEVSGYLPKTFFVCCGNKDCLTEGPAAESVEAALALWNRRAEPAGRVHTESLVEGRAAGVPNALPRGLPPTDISTRRRGISRIQ
jgi:Restriction alleviation protein Lar